MSRSSRAGWPGDLAARFARNWRITFDWRKGRPQAPAPRLSLVVIFLLLAAIDVALAAWLLDGRAAAFVAAQSEGVFTFFNTLTRYGKSDWILIPAAVLIVLGFVGDWRRCAQREAAAWAEILAFAAAIVLVVAASGLLTDLFKVLVGRMRPLHAEHVLDFAPLAFGGYRNYSFPSGHATVMGAMGFVFAIGPRWLRAPALVATLAIAVSRVMVNAHYPSDVVAGLIVGAMVAFLIVRALAYAGYGFRRDPTSGVLSWRFDVLRALFRRGRTGAIVRLTTALAAALRAGSS